VFLGVSVVGWGILVLAYLPVALVLRRLALRSGARSTAFTVTAALTSIPFMATIGEAAYVDHNWRAFCATAKTEVSRRVVVEGFYDAGVSSSYNHFRQAPVGFRHGFRFVEWKDQSGRIWRTEGFNEPELRTVQIERATARYHRLSLREAEPVSHLIRRHTDTVTDSLTGEVTAQKVIGLRYPAFVDRLWRQWFDNTPEVCEDKSVIWGDMLQGIDRREEAR
jgi:hypothetical protein